MNAYNKLWTKTAFKNVPALGAQEGKGDDAIAYVKIFSIRDDRRWYVLEYDPETGRAFCLVTNQGDAELGDSAINEVHPGDYDAKDREGIMQWVNDRSAIIGRVPPFERDSSFKPTTVAKIREKMVTLCPA